MIISNQDLLKIYLILKIILYEFPIKLSTAAISLRSLENSNTDRLPDHIVPIHYTIEINPYIEENNFTFDGESFIEIKVNSESDLLILHAQNLQIIEKITLKNIKNKYESSKYVIDDITNFLTAEFSEKILKGFYILHLKYSGKINYFLTGLYRSDYTDIFEKKQWLISTQFEPSYARQVFPCWDEPAIKATFQISIKHNRKHTALSNTQFSKIYSADDGSNQVWTCFEKTPVMSTYLIAFVVGDLDYLSSSEDGTFRVWTRKNSVSRGKNLLEIGIKAFNILENFTGIPFKDHGFKKFDLVAIPKLHSLAVENWGLIFLNEPEVLFDDKISNKRKENDYLIVTHELSHQWFGNLVTHQWWKYLWLTEGLSTYFSYVVNDEIHKSWHMIDSFIIDKENVLVADSQKSIPTMNENVELLDVFDHNHSEINYYKSAFVIRMIKYVLGEENFRIGIRNYLQHNKFEAVTSEHFNGEMVKVSGEMNKTFEKALINWENTPGYPVITISRNYTTNQATITQSRFLMDRMSDSADRYWIAMNFAFEDYLDFDNTSITHWYEPEVISLNVIAPQEDKWLICNKQQFGYYRVNYDERNWKLIIKFLKSSNYDKIHYLNRAELIDDAFMLAETGYLSYRIPFELIEYLEQETNYVPWVVFFEQLTRLYTYSSLRYSSYYENFKKFVLTLFKKLEKEFYHKNLAEDNYLELTIKESIIKWTCELGSNLCKSYTLTKIKKWLEDSDENAFPADLKSEILCSGLLYADENIWYQVLEKYFSNKDHELLGALACTLNYKLLYNLMSMALNYKFGKFQLWRIKFAVLSKSPLGVDVILDIINDHYLKFIMTDSRYNFIYGSVISIVPYIKNDDQCQKWNKIVLKMIDEKKAEKAQELIKYNIQFNTVRLNSIKDYFNTQ